MGILKPDLGKLVWLAAGIAAAVWFPVVTRVIPRKG